MRKESAFSNQSLLMYSLYAIVVLMQLQVDIHIAETTLRISACDFLIPLFFLFTIYIKPKEILQQAWKIKWLPIWFITFTVWLGISLWIGYRESGFLSKWALTNKFMGWFMLMGYFWAGGYTKHLTHEVLHQLFKVLLMSSWFINIFCIFSWSTLLYRYHPSWEIGVNDSHRFIGFLQNPNAFGIFNVVLLLLSISINSQQLLFPRWLTVIGYTLNILAIVGSGSRGAFITGIFGLIILMLRKVISFRSVFLILTTAISILLGSFWLNKVFLRRLFSYMYYFSPWQFSDSGVIDRINQIKFAINWWLQSPITGIGLGSYLHRQIEQNMLPLSTIHQTPLWLLTETGLIGLILMLVFCYTALKVLYQSSIFSKSNALANGGLTIILACALASLTSEIMYQRYLWFFLGMLLVKSIRETQSMKHAIANSIIPQKLNNSTTLN